MHLIVTRLSLFTGLEYWIESFSFLCTFNRFSYLCITYIFMVDFVVLLLYMQIYTATLYSLK